ncbi:hypothetical protein [Halobacteriovorax marinus]|uniref:hypothetical protein n=1 Tax=Halobacteriovorax marinus TaxID=97084 RepID=UPI003A93E918
MKSVRTLITFLFIIAAQSSWALPGEGSADPRLADENGDQYSVDHVKDSAQARRLMAQRICEGERKGVVDERLKMLMEVGLYNYCDQYEDEERFCGCVGETTYEEKLSDNELKEFEERLKAESKKNIALNSFKVLKEYREEKNREMANRPGMPSHSRFENTLSRQSCDDTKDLHRTLEPFCKESDLVELKKSLSLAIEDCDNCAGMDLDTMPQAPEARRRRTAGEDFLYFPTHWLNKEFSKQANADIFKVQEINNRNPDNFTKYKSIGDFQYKELVADIALRIKNKWSGTNFNMDSVLNQAMITKRQNAAFVMMMENYYLLQDIEGFPRKQYYYANSTEIKRKVDDYLNFFMKQFPVGVFDKSTVDVGTIATSIEIFLEKAQNDKLNKKCQEIIDVMKTSCAAMSNEEQALSFDFNADIAKKIRENHYSDNKFKFDQLYCVAQDKSEPRVFESGLKRWGIGRVDVHEKLVSPGKKLFTETKLDINDGSLNTPVFDSGVSFDISDTLITGNHNEYLRFIMPSTELTDEDESILDLANNYKGGKENGDFSLGKDALRRYGVPQIYGNNYFGFNGSDYSSSHGYGYGSSTYNGINISIDQFYKNIGTSPSQGSTSILDRNLGPTQEEAPEDVPPRAIIVDENTLEDVPGQVAAGSGNVPTQDDGTLSERSEASVSASDSFDANGESFSSQDGSSESRSPASVTNTSNIESNPTNTAMRGQTQGSSSMNFSMGNSFFSNRSQFAKNEEEQRELSREEIMENRIRELEQRVQESNSAAPIKAASSLSSETRISGSSFSKESKKGEKDDSLELTKMKVELEKLKLELAKSELELKKKNENIKAQNERAAASNTSAATTAAVEGPTNKNIFASRGKKSTDTHPTSARSSNSNSTTNTASSSRKESASASAPVSTSQSSSATYSGASAPSDGGSFSGSVSSTGASSASSSGALLSATQIEDSQIRSNTGPSIVSYQNFSEISAANQSELSKLYTEFGAQVITQGGTEVILEKDETTGEIKVIEKDKTSAAVIEKVLSKKRAPASEPAPSEQNERKRFSLQEFNQIIDNGVKKE